MDIEKAMDLQYYIGGNNQGRWEYSFDVGIECVLAMDFDVMKTTFYICIIQVRT